MEKLTPEERKALARKAAKQRWERSKDTSMEVAGQKADYEPIILEKTQPLPVA